MITDIDRMYSASSILFTFMQSFTPIGLYCWTRSLVVKWSHHGIEMAESNIVLAIVRFSYASFQSMISFRFVVKTRLSQCQCQYQCQVIGNYRTVPRSPYLSDASLSIFLLLWRVSLSMLSHDVEKVFLNCYILHALMCFCWTYVIMVGVYCAVQEPVGMLRDQHFAYY